ncbi:uncharacterized protein [Cicer arietinum]|uniref:Acyl-CoA-binding domain-containing protein 6-like isoform X1 n=1 Tax=Cicer arietinum TaxID=3827 RepID=A0A1S2YQD8_CICAR|nr:acyl-CoA-binding domain-containing protein 6-like isoform X1 [Cicer arietinum]
MFGFSRRRTKLGRLKVQQLSEGTRSPIIVRHPKRIPNSILNGEEEEDGDAVAGSSGHSDENVCSDISSSSSAGSDNWVLLSISGDKPIPRFNHAAAVIGNKIIVVGGESATGLLDDVQVLNFDTFSWTTASSKLYLSPSSLPLKIPACKGHSLVSWGEKVLLVGGKTDLGSDKISVWEFDTKTEHWSLMEAKGDIPVARSGHSVVRASSALILFGGKNAKRRKLNDLHMFDLKSLTWLPLHYTGAAPCPRFNHVAALYDDKVLYIFGGSSKSRTLNDLYSLDFEKMAWSRVKIRGFRPSPRTGCCGVLCGTKWYITGGGSRKKRYGDTMIFDILKKEWSMAIASPPSSVTTNKGFSLVLMQHKEKDFLVAFGGSKKEPSNQVEVLAMEKIESAQPVRRRSTPRKGPASILLEEHSASTRLDSQLNDCSQRLVDSVARQNLTSTIQHGSRRKSLSESLVVDPNCLRSNIFFCNQFDHDEEYNYNTYTKMDKNSKESSLPQAAVETNAIHGNQMNIGEAKIDMEEQQMLVSEILNQQNQISESNTLESDSELFPENSKAGSFFNTNIYHYYESEVTALTKKNTILEAQLVASLASEDTATKNLESILRSRQEIEEKLSDTLKEMEVMREKLASLELTQEEVNNLSNVVHSDNVRLEHDVAFLKAVLDDTQKELHSTRGVVARERGRAFQLQCEAFHLNQRLQSMENQASTPRKPFHVQ